MNEQFDLVVLGTGAAASTVARNVAPRVGGLESSIRVHSAEPVPSGVVTRRRYWSALLM